MTLNDLRESELSLMRTAFDRACRLAGLSLDPSGRIEKGGYARIAATVQRLVECGCSDLETIALKAAVSGREEPALLTNI
jgi:hypothetical protein